MPGFDRIRLPGDDRRKRRADRSANGVQLPATLVKQLDDLAASLKLQPLARALAYSGCEAATVESATLGCIGLAG